MTTPEPFDMTRSEAMRLVRISDCRVFKRDYQQHIPSIPWTSERPDVRLFRESDIIRRQNELAGVPENDPELIKDVKAWRKNGCK